MNIYRKAISKLKRITASVGEELGEIQKSEEEGKETPCYMDCANENELIDAYGCGIITKKQLEDGKQYFKDIEESKGKGHEDYKKTLEILNDAIGWLYQAETDDENEAKRKDK